MTTYHQGSLLWENQQEQWQRIIEACILGLQHKSCEVKANPGYKAGNLACLSYIVENHQSAIAILDQQLKYVYANNRYLDEYAVTAQALLGQSPRSIFPDFPPSWYEAYQLSLSGQVISMNNEPYIRPDGKKDWANWECRPWFETDGTIGGIMIYTEMIPPRKKAELAMRENADFFQSIYDQISLGIGLVDSQTSQVLRANTRFTELLRCCGARKGDSPAHPFDLLQDQHDLLLLRSGHAGRIASVSQFDRSDGSRIWLSIKITPSESDFGSGSKCLWMVEDISEYKQKESDLLFQSNHDALTGLYNRSYFDQEKERLDAENQLPFSVIIGDINGLKMINDAFGRASGDKLLVETAKILQSCCRQSDILARTGGDEFYILMPQTDSATAAAILKQINQVLKEHESSSRGGAHFLSLSLGYGTKERFDQSADIMVRTAEEHMLRRKILEQRSLHSSILSSIKATMHEKSHETREHGERLAELAKNVGKELGLSDSQLQDLELLSNVHDIGKIIIDDKILNKPDKLTEQEWVEMKKHPDIGYRIAQASPDIRHISDSILCHHERWDGKGYPHGLAGEAIPMFARILAIVDAFDAMTNDRTYRKAMPVDAAIQEIKNGAGKQFDPEISGVFARLMAKDRQTV